MLCSVRICSVIFCASLQCTPCNSCSLNATYSACLQGELPVLERLGKCIWSPPYPPPTHTHTKATHTPHTQPRQGELPVRERLGKYAREHVLLKENEFYEDDGDNAGD